MDRIYQIKHKPEWWIRVSKLLETHPIGDLAVEMFMFVQGRVDASLMWAIKVEDFLSNDLKLLANRANPCVYSGIVNNEPVILGRATDDFLCAFKKVDTYDYIVTHFELNGRSTPSALYALSSASTLFLLLTVSLSIKPINARKLYPKFLDHRGDYRNPKAPTIFQ
jgi:hypothetical protein